MFGEGIAHGVESLGGFGGTPVVAFGGEFGGVGRGAGAVVGGGVVGVAGVVFVDPVGGNTAVITEWLVF